MAPIIAPEVARFAINGSMPSGVTWTNIWDVRLDSTDAGVRETACENYAEALFDAWVDTWLTLQTTEVSLNNVTWVDLNSLDGSTGTFSSGSPTGDVSGAPQAASVSALVTKTTTAARGDRPGRMYVIGLPEGNADWVVWTAAYLDTLTGVANAFMAATEDPVGVAVPADPVVVHTRNEGTPTAPDIVFSSATAVTGLVVQTRMATQRRRLRRG